MATEIKFRRGSTAQHSTFTGAAGEVTVDTDKNTVVVHDGVTPGGNPLPTNTTVVPIDNSISTAKIQNSAVTTAKIADSNVTGVKLSTTSDNTVDDADEILYLSSSTLKRSTLTGLISSIFNGTRKIANGWFNLATFKLWNAGGTFGYTVTGTPTADRNISLPDRSIDLDNVNPPDVKAWVNFNGTGPVTIRASKNVSSIMDNGTGDYTINFITPMVDVNYAVIATGSTQTAGAGNSVIIDEIESPSRSVSSVRIVARISTNNAVLDVLYVNVVIIR